MGLLDFVKGKAPDGGLMQSMLKWVLSDRNAPARNTADLIRAYNEMPWLRAVASRVGHATATTPWKLYVVRNSQGKAIQSHKMQTADFAQRREFIRKAAKNGDIEEIEDHPALRFLRGGNQYITSLEAGKLTQVYLDLVGEAFLLVERGPFNVPTAWWPIPPSWVKDTPRPGHDFFVMNVNGTEKQIPMSEMIWLRDPNPVNPYERGTGIARALADELDTDEFAAKHIKDFFYNGARPDLLVTADGLSPQDTSRMEEDWNRKNRGLHKNRRAHFLNKKVDIHEFSQDFRSMEMTNLRKYERNTIINVYGVPPEILGIIESSNRATIESASYIFARWVLVPRLEMQRATFQERLIPQFDDRLILDFESPVDEDKQFRLETMKAAPYAFNMDEFREMAEFEELPDDKGKQHAVQFNQIFTTFGGEPTAPEGPEPGANGETDTETDTETDMKGITKALDPSKVEILVHEITGDPFATLLVPVLDETAKSFGQRTLDEAGVDQVFEERNQRVNEFIRQQSLERMDSLTNETTRQALREELVQSLEAGESRKQTSNRIKKVFKEADDRRARVIARTETVRVANFATQEGMQQAGVPEKEWLSSRDERVRDHHLSLDSVTVPTQGEFVSPETGATAQHPGDFGRPVDDIQCRCIIVSKFPDQKSGESEAVRKSIWKAFEAEREPFEAQAKRAVSKAFKQQQDAVLAALDTVY